MGDPPTGNGQTDDTDAPDGRRFFYFALFVIAVVSIVGFAVWKTQQTTSKPGQPDRVFTLLATGDGLQSRDGEASPRFTVQKGQRVLIRVINKDGRTHSLVLPELGVRTGAARSKGDIVTARFDANEVGEYTYYCGTMGHRALSEGGIFAVDKDKNKTTSKSKSKADTGGRDR